MTVLEFVLFGIQGSVIVFFLWFGCKLLGMHPKNDPEFIVNNIGGAIFICTAALLAFL